MTKPNRGKRPSKHDQLSMMTQAVQDLMKRRQWLADTYLPGDDVVGAGGELTDDQAFGVVAITAIEEEWLVDPELREELSIISYVDED